MLVGCSVKSSETDQENKDQLKEEQKSKEGLQSENSSKTENQTDQQKVISVVEQFGKALKNVSLLSPEEVVQTSIKENYEEFLSPQLLAAWLKNPERALGRTVSSPWPDRIELINATKSSENSFDVTGTIIEVTSVEMESGGSAAERPITLTLNKIEGSWRIDNVVVGDYAQKTGIQYENTKYGFTFSLPDSWEGYQIVTDKWTGTPINNESKDGERGPILYIRHPAWTSDKPRQDIPIMIFTRDQWSALQKEEFHVGAAPMNPKELDRNNQYVFALPARYNFAFLEGFEEVEKILEKNPLVVKDIE
jgi:hypothetical protein